MKRTKQWWAALTKEERSELHRLEYAMSGWIHRHQIEPNRCNFCRESWYEFGICPGCLNKRNQLIKKANKVILCKPK